MESNEPILKKFYRGDLLLGIGLIFLILLMLIPLNTFALDLLLSLSLACSLGILLMTVFNIRPSDFESFPSLLLLVTVFRLSLNIASTRIILSNGHLGDLAAGKVINAFGHIIINENFVVGLVIFSVLVIINFMVITKGAARISEVSARFMLDALPGRQGAIEHELRMGVITNEEAAKKRESLQKETDFHGAMDGASKFVRGDAIAGLLIVGINVVGGIFIGVLQNSLDLVEALRTYTLLTIGDGLVTQIPALCVSIASGLVVTKASSSKISFARQIQNQIQRNSKLFYILGSAFLLLAIFFNVAFAPFFIVSILAFTTGFFLNNGSILAFKKHVKTPKPPIGHLKNKEPNRLKIEVGLKLTPMFDQRLNAVFLAELNSLSSSIFSEYGMQAPRLIFNDNKLIPEEMYRINIGTNVFEKGLKLNKKLVFNSKAKSDGSVYIEPVFGFRGYWVPMLSRADERGISAESLFKTHFVESIRRSISSFIDRAVLIKLVDELEDCRAKDWCLEQEEALKYVLEALRLTIKQGFSLDRFSSLLNYFHCIHREGIHDEEQMMTAIRHFRSNETVEGLKEIEGDLRFFKTSSLDLNISSLNQLILSVRSQYLAPIFVSEVKEFKEFGRILEQLPENGLAPIQHILQSDWEAIGAKTTPHCLNSELRKIYGSEEIRG